MWRKLSNALKTLVHPLNKSKIWCEQKNMYRIYSSCSIQTSTGRITMYEPNLQAVPKDISLQLAGESHYNIYIYSILICKWWYWWY